MVKIDNTKSNLYKSSLNVFILFVTLLVLLILYFSSAWFSNSKKVNPGSMSAMLDNYNIDVNVSGDLDYSQMQLGGTKKITVNIVSHEKKPIKINLAFAAPDETEELPLERNSMYYYLSTQLKVTSITSSSGELTKNGLNKYLFNIDNRYDEYSLPDFTGLESKQTIPRFDIATMTLEANQSATVEFEIIYVNSRQNQNVFKEIVNCKRRLYCSFSN